MTDKQIIEPCMGCSALECWGVVDCDVAQRVLALHKTLTEIKEIAERDKEFCNKCDGDKEIDCIECIEGGRALLAKEILQKISEAQDG